ncbi:MAG: hypothetical protein K8R25_18270 [Methanosarcinales archaeon]|nr:hypothetical protein [Methanosarcinales archaeon]
MNKINSMLVALVMVMGVFAPLVSADIVTTEAVLSGGSLDPIIHEMFVWDYDENTNMNEIIPEPGSGNDEVWKTFYKYVIVSDPNGISELATVFEELRDPAGNPLTTEAEMVDITWTSEVNDVIDQALACGVITQAEYDEYEWGLRPDKLQYKMYKIANELNNHHEPGDYIVYFKVVDNTGKFSENTCTFAYIGINAMEIDFNNVNYGEIQVESEKTIAGDETFDPTGTSDKPTIKNQGNVNIQIKVLGADLIGLYEPIQTIGASALSVELLGDHRYDISSWVTLGPELIPCTPTQICFDINAPSGTTANTYAGSLSIVIA